MVGVHQREVIKGNGLRQLTRDENNTGSKTRDDAAGDQPAIARPGVASSDSLCEGKIALDRVEHA
jgi:hypothetical protein